MLNNSITEPQTGTDTKPMFNVGDTVYYPGKGVCTVKTVYHNRFVEGEEPVFVLKPQKGFSSLQRLVLPLGKAFELGVHKLNPEADISSVWQTLESNPHDLSQDRRGGYKGVKEKIFSGDLTKVAEAARDLKTTHDRFLFSPRKHLLNIAKRMLVEEVAFIEGKSDQEIEQIVENKLVIHGGKAQ